MLGLLSPVVACHRVQLKSLKNQRTLLRPNCNYFFEFAFILKKKTNPEG